MKGWKYLRRGECTDCALSQTQLFVPVLQGTQIENTAFVGGEHIPHFDPVCLTCKENYVLDAICKDHRLPTKVETGRCKLCVTASDSRRRDGA